MRITGGHRPERHGDREMRAERDALLRRMTARSRVTVGVDLGKMVDFTAIVIAERERRGDGRVHHVIRSLERLELGTDYADVADRAAEVVQNLEALGRQRDADGVPGVRVDLVVDAGGVGVAVVDLFRERRLTPVPVTIVAGMDVNEREDRSLTVGKGHLVGTLEILLQTDRLHLPDTAEADLLEAELQD